jgi:outer membrane protein OmpA-like peptidoglycan-associated protein
MPFVGRVIDLRVVQMRLKSIFTGLCTFTLLLGANTSFAEEVGQWYVGGMGTYIDPDSDRDLDSDFAGLKLVGGRVLSEHWNIEIEASMLDVTGDNGPDTDFTGQVLNGMYLWNRSSKFTPYLLAGAGYLAPAATGAVAAAALDTDGDGVSDLIDECPNTVKGAKVNDVGCAYELTLSGTNYDVNAAVLSESGQKALNDVAESLKNFPEVNITIEGYTDSDGSEAYNQDLSERRAKSARDYLVRRGVPGTRITAYGLGEANPVASNDTSEGRAQNRRVVLTKDE